MEIKHKSVLLDECIDNLLLKSDSVIVDCTLGYGGHSSEILKRINKGFLFAFDQDSDAIKSSFDRLSSINSNFEIINSNFVNIKKELEKRNITKVDGILYDLGVSSPQLDEKDRGFSFHQDARLDMRMDKNQSLSAYEVVNNYSYQELVNILYKYGEEKYATSIARGIVNCRPIETTLELTEVIKNNVPEKYRREKHPARKTFQAIRIEVNDELNVFEKSLKDALELINVGGRICVITFHSLEDRAVKQAFSDAEGKCTCPKDLPYCICNYKSYGKIVNKKPIVSTEEELKENSRAQSAKLRIFERKEVRTYGK